MLRICSCCALFLALTLPAAAEIAGKVRVIDGDTIDVGETRVRLHGIDAPERDQPCTTQSGQRWGCGDWATRQVRDRFEGAQALCAPVDTDRYGRTVASCTVAGRDMGRTLVQEGWALAYRRYSMAYDLDEKAAFVAKRGLHGHSMEAPARYRETARAGQGGGEDCRIKGNISADGARIYHLPGQEFYTRTRISAEKGERWFCSEAQARASGWRRARR